LQLMDTIFINKVRMIILKLFSEVTLLNGIPKLERVPLVLNEFNCYMAEPLLSLALAVCIYRLSKESKLN